MKSTEEILAFVKKLENDYQPLEPSDMDDYNSGALDIIYQILNFIDPESEQALDELTKIAQENDMGY